MKFNLKNGFICFLSGVAVATAIPTMAKNVTETISVAYKDIKVFVDGKELNTGGNEPFIYNGTTYLPIRKVSEAVGKEASWNGSNKTVYIGSHPGSDGYIFDIMQPFESGHYRQFIGNNSFDYAGEKRKNGFKLDYGGYVIFKLGGKYNVLNFDCISNDANGKIQVIADGKVVQEVFAPKDGDVKSVSLSLTGVDELKFTSSGYAGFWNVKVY